MWHPSILSRNLVWAMYIMAQNLNPVSISQYHPQFGPAQRGYFSDNTEVYVRYLGGDNPEQHGAGRPLGNNVRNIKIRVLDMLSYPPRQGHPNGSWSITGEIIGGREPDDPEHADFDYPRDRFSLTPFDRAPQPGGGRKKRKRRRKRKTRRKNAKKHFKKRKTRGRKKRKKRKKIQRAGNNNRAGTRGV